MSKGQFDSLKSTECICGQTFNRGEDKARHSKKCEAYQKYKNEYMTFDKINDYLNNQRLNKIELYAIYPYNMFCLSDYVKFFKQHPMNNRYYITDNGTRLTIDEIKSMLNKDFLYQKYVVEGLDAIQINELLNNTFSVQTIFEWLKRYGIKTRSASDVTKKCLNKMKKTCLEKYGVENVSVLDEIKQQKKQTTFKHYGVEHHLQDKKILDNLRNTVSKRYGGVINVSQIKEIQDKKNQTCLEHYGIENIFQDKEYIKQCVKDKYGVDNVSKLGWVKEKKFESYEHLTSNGVAYSKSSIELFDKISENFPSMSDYFKYATHGGETHIFNHDIGMFCAVDFSYIPSKIIIEYNGDIWHANPLKYKNTDHPIFDHPELSSEDIWKRDKKRIDFLQSQGYQVHIVWESDFQKDPQKIINECCDFIKQNISD